MLRRRLRMQTKLLKCILLFFYRYDGHLVSSPAPFNYVLCISNGRQSCSIYFNRDTRLGVTRSITALIDLSLWMRPNLNWNFREDRKMKEWSKLIQCNNSGPQINFNQKKFENTDAPTVHSVQQKYNHFLSRSNFRSELFFSSKEFNLIPLFAAASTATNNNKPFFPSWHNILWT